MAALIQVGVNLGKKNRHPKVATLCRTRPKRSELHVNAVCNSSWPVDLCAYEGVWQRGGVTRGATPRRHRKARTAIDGNEEEWRGGTGGEALEPFEGEPLAARQVSVLHLHPLPTLLHARRHRFILSALPRAQQMSELCAYDAALEVGARVTVEEFEMRLAHSDEGLVARDVLLRLTSTVSPQAIHLPEFRPVLHVSDDQTHLAFAALW